MGLLKTGIRAAVAVKTADVIHERVLARPERHAAAYGHSGATAAVARPMAGALMPAAPASADMSEKQPQVKEFGELRAAGVLTDAEFEVQKARILSA
jgi:Short C-terminal domain